MFHVPPVPAHRVLGQLDLAALQVRAQHRRALQRLSRARQPLQQLLQLVLELPQPQQRRLQPVLRRGMAALTMRSPSTHRTAPTPLHPHSTHTSVPPVPAG